MVYFLVQVKHTNDAYEKGVVVKETQNAALQSFHAYLGAYAYGNNANTDYVYVEVIDDQGTPIERKVWDERETEEESEE